MNSKSLNAVAIGYIQDQEFVEPGIRITLDFEEAVQTFKAGYERAIDDVIRHIEAEWYYNGMADADEVAQFVKVSFKAAK